MPSWMYFVLALAGLLAGYCVYGAIVEKVFGPDPNRPTPACKMPDGVDYVETSPTKVFLIQLLNIAGLGPVFGPILGALYGPIALLWVVIGCVFAGAVHDYFSGMLSVRYNGKSVPDIVGYNLGDLIKKLMRVFAVVLLILVGVVFVAGPAGLLSQWTGMHSMLLSLIHICPFSSMYRMPSSPWTLAISCGSATTLVVPCGSTSPAKRAGLTMLDSIWMWASMRPGSR